jgi:hypothetical protein
MTFTPSTASSHVLPPKPALRDAVTVLSHLTRVPGFLASRVLPLVEEANRAEDWYVAYRHDGPALPALFRSSFGPGLSDEDPRPFFLGSLLLCGGVRPGRTLRAHR